MDTRVPLEPIELAFGVPATVTEPWATPVPATVVWLRPLQEDVPVGREYTRRGPRWVMAVRQDQVPELQRGSIVRAAGPPGDTVRNWQVDSIEIPDREYFYAVVVPRTVGV